MNDNPTFYLPPDNVPADRWLEWVAAQITEKYEALIVTGDYDYDPSNINLLAKPLPVIGRYTLLMSHGLPARHIEHFVFNRRGKRGDNG